MLGRESKGYNLTHEAIHIAYRSSSRRLSRRRQRHHGVCATRGWRWRRCGASAGPFGALRWRNIGPPRGGRSIAVAGSAARPSEYDFGASGGGSGKTVDGDMWDPVADGH